MNRLLRCSALSLSSPASLARDERSVLFDVPARRSRDGATWEARLHAWVFEPEDSLFRRKALEALLRLKYQLHATDAEQAENLRQRANLFFVDNERRKLVPVEIEADSLTERVFTLGPTRPNGHAHRLIQLPALELTAAAERGFVEISSPHPHRLPAARARIHLIRERGISVISDIDDTFKQTRVDERKELLAHTFLRRFEAVRDMPELYRRWHAQGAALHFVSSSPWQLYEPLKQFMRDVQAPPATLHLKLVRFKDRSLLSLFEKGLTTKPRQIRPLLEAYPTRSFVLVGDSGEHDPEVYAELYREHPARIARIYIRNLGGEARTSSRYQLAFRDVPEDRWELFERPLELELPAPRSGS